MISSFHYLAMWLRARVGNSERGASLVEYALLLALIAVFCIAALVVVGGEANETFESVGSQIADSNNGP